MADAPWLHYNVSIMDYSFLNSLPISYSGLSSLTGLAYPQSLSTLDRYQSLGESGDSSDGSQTPANFKDLLAVLLAGLNTQSSNLTLNDDETDIFGFSFNTLMMPVMINLLEQLMERDFSPLTSATTSLEAATSCHINQFDAERQIGGDGMNANCGPTSLAIALHALGLRVKGETESTSLGQVVDLARLSMISDASRDGIDATGRRLESEHGTFTNLDEILRGAIAAGARANRVTASAESIRRALESGAKVIVSGTFVGKSPLPWTGDRGIDNQIAPGHATLHLVAVTAYDRQTNQFVVNDPARNTPLLVSGAVLEQFMSGNAGALAIYRV